MRLLLQYVTDESIAPDQLKTILSQLGWLPTNADLGERKRLQLLGRLPEEVKDEVTSGNPIAITPRTGVWGLVSTEVENRIKIRLIHNDLDTLRDEANKAVRKFPETFARVTAKDTKNSGFDPQVVIRRFDSEERVIAGTVQLRHLYRFREYLRKMRRREFKLVVNLAIIAGVLALASMLIFWKLQGPTWRYVQGYMDRGATTVLTAVLTTLLVLMFEFREWKNERISIVWNFANTTTPDRTEASS